MNENECFYYDYCVTITNKSWKLRLNQRRPAFDWDMNPKLQWAANIHKLYYIFFDPLLCIKVNRNVLFKALRYLNILSDTTLVKQELLVTFLGKVTYLVWWMLHDSNLLKRGMLFWLHISDFRKSRAVSATLYYC